MYQPLALVLTAGSFQSGADPLLSRLAGQWTGTGTVLNQPSKSRWRGPGNWAGASFG